MDGSEEEVAESALDEHGRYDPRDKATPVRMSNGSRPSEVAIAFDLMAELYNRRLGYGFEWDRLASRTSTDWDAWLNGRLRPLRW